MNKKKSIALVALLIVSFIFTFSTQAAVHQTNSKSKIIELTPTTFKAQTSKGLVLVDVWAPWCGFCKKMSPILDALANEYSGNRTIKFTKLNADIYKSFSEDLQVTGLPTILVYKNGKEATRIIGYTAKESVKEVIEKNK